MSIKSWIIGKLHSALADYGSQPEQPISGRPHRRGNLLQTVASRNIHQIQSNGMDFTIYSGTGGYVLEYHGEYNQKTDERDHFIHLIPDSEDLGESVSKILTLELLR